MDTSSWPSLVYSLFATPTLLLSQLQTVDWMALILAILGPVLIFFARNEVRLRRLRQIQDFYNIFTAGKDSAVSTANTPLPRQPQNTAGQADARPNADNGLATNPSFEFVRSKYTADLDVPEGDDYEALPESRKLKLLITAARTRKTVFAYRLFLSSAGFMLLSYFGFHVFITAIGCGLRITAACPVPDIGAGPYAAKVIVIGSLAFIGGYIGAMRTLIARLAVFDLSSNTFLRITVETLASVLLAMILFAAFSDPATTVGNILIGAGPPPDNAANNDAAIPIVWIALAPLFGLLPQSSTKFLLVKLQSYVSWVKTTDDRFVGLTPIISLDVIDGVDYETRFRLEDCGIYDVQNLATYNPILLHIETPYGIYQCIDWIAQAQLCHIVGLERFLILREMNIRTIFDLERAIDSIHSPDQFDEIYSGILLAPTGHLKRVVDIAKTQFIIKDQQGTRLVSVDDYVKWSREQLGAGSGPLVSRSVEHLMSWITDDLHVRRLRRLWNDIAVSLEPGSSYFEDSKRNPGNITNRLK